MRTFLLTLLVLAVAKVLVPYAGADTNAAPTNVGLYNFSTFTVGTATTSQILARNPARAGLIVQNQGAVSVVIKPGSTPTSSTDGLVLTTGQFIQFDKVPVDALYGKSASSTAAIVMMEFVK